VAKAPQNALLSPVLSNDRGQPTAESFPAGTLGQVFAHVPESKQGHTQAQPPIKIKRLKQPVEREAKVIDLSIALRQPARPIRGAQFWISLFSQNQTVRRMCPPYGRLLAAIGEAFEGITRESSLTSQNVARFGAIQPLNQILVHEGGQPFEEIDTEVVTGVADGFRPSTWCRRHTETCETVSPRLIQEP